MDRLVTVKGNRYGMEIYMDSEDINEIITGTASELGAAVAGD